MPKNTMLVVGSLNMDQVVHVPRIPLLGETLMSTSARNRVPGGKGANQAVAMARLGAPVAMDGRLGSDRFGEALLRSLRADNVNTDLIVVDQEESSGVALIYLTPAGDNAIVVASGANMRVGQDRAQLSAIFEAITQARVLLLQLEIPLETVGALIAAGHNAGTPVVLNLAPAQALPWETLKQVQVLVVNETEIALLTGRQVNEVEEARAPALALHKQGIASIAVTLGAQGAILVTTGGHGVARVIYQSVPAFQDVVMTAAWCCCARRV